MQKLLSISDFSELTGLALQTVYNRHSTMGDLPPTVKIGRNLKFRTEDVEQWINARVQRPAPAPTPAPAPRPPGRPTKAEQVARRAFAGA